MVRQCEICNHNYDISEIYVGRRLRNWPKCMCLNCREKYPKFNSNKYTPTTSNNPLDILLNAGYPREYALRIVDQGL